MLIKFNLLHFYVNVNINANAKNVLLSRLPTVFVSECVLVYMTPSQSSNLVRWAAETLHTALFISYEQVHRAEDRVSIGGNWLAQFICTGTVNDPVFVSPTQSFRWTWAIDLARLWSRTCSAATATWQAWRSATLWTHRFCSGFAWSWLNNLKKKKDNSTLKILMCVLCRRIGSWRRPGSTLMLWTWWRSTACCHRRTWQGRIWLKQLFNDVIAVQEFYFANF